MWTNYVLVLAQVLKEAQFNGALQIYCLGIPIVCILILTRRLDKYELLIS